MSTRKIILLALFASLLSAALPRVSYSWQTVFEVRPGNGSPIQKHTIQTMTDPQSTVMIGIEVMGVRIGYDSRYGLSALIEF